MHGHERIRKKHLKLAGYQILGSENSEDGYHLRLKTPEGEEVEILAATQPRAYLQAEHKLLPPQEWIKS